MAVVKFPVRLTEGDPNFVNEIVKIGGPLVYKCLQCGRCAGDCPLGIEPLHHIRRLIKLAIYGLRERVLSDPGIWRCTTCHTCWERCPLEVDPTDFVIALRRILAREGKMPDSTKRIARNIVTLGHAVDIDEKQKKIRASLGLDPLPPTALIHKEATDDLKTIVKKTKVQKLIGSGGK